MSNLPVSTTTFALQDILMGIADSLNEAQEALRSAPPYDALGRPNTLYQLPYLDFSLKVTSEFESEQSADPEADPRKAIRFRSVKEVATTKNTSSRTEILSTISGRFVASVPNEGLPQTIIDVRAINPVVTKDGYYQYDLEVQLSNAAGEKLIDSVVEFNFDEDASAALNASQTLSLPLFSTSEVKTDATGIARSSVKLHAEAFDKGTWYIITVNNGTVNKSISLSKH